MILHSPWHNIPWGSLYCNTDGCLPKDNTMLLAYYLETNSITDYAVSLEWWRTYHLHVLTCITATLTWRKRDSKTRTSEKTRKEKTKGKVGEINEAVIQTCVMSGQQKIPTTVSKMKMSNKRSLTQPQTVWGKIQKWKQEKRSDQSAEFRWWDRAWLQKSWNSNSKY